MENILTFQGRIGRLDYFFILIINVIVTVLILFLNLKSVLGLILVLPVVLSVSWLYVCASIKRFHDLNRSGSNLWLFLIPFYGIYLGWGLLLFRKGTNGSNMYGENPIEDKNLSPKENTAVVVEKSQVDIEGVMFKIFYVLLFLGIVYSFISMYGY